MIHEMYICQVCMILKEINVIYIFVTIFSIVHSLINSPNWRKRNKYYSVLTQKFFLVKRTFPYWNLKDKLFKLLKVPNDPNCCFIVLWKILRVVMSPLSEWSIASIAVLSCKTSTFSSKYILNEVQGMWFYTNI